MLAGAQLNYADPTGADGLTQAQLTLACGVPAILPTGFHPSPMSCLS
jgi:hypothetical protein